MEKQNSQEPCHHEWRKNYEERVIFEDGAGQHTGLRPKWTCKKCGKISWVNPTT